LEYPLPAVIEQQKKIAEPPRQNASAERPDVRAALFIRACQFECRRKQSRQCFGVHQPLPKPIRVQIDGVPTLAGEKGTAAIGGPPYVDRTLLFALLAK
jgi:hypothetical protein